jgi:acyl transferase domain-containing protein/acyl carrier protein
MTPPTPTTGLEIAIIGMAGRFPGAETLEQFWQNLRDGIESIAQFTEAELVANGVAAELLTQPDYVKAEGAIAGLETFDAAFFGFSPREAEILDPQHRWFLDCAWTALENAGYDAEQYSGAIGVYGGAAANPYLFNLIRNPEIGRSVSHYQLMLANDKDFLTTRVSYKLNLRGPSLDIQTACSTSLVAVHVACQSLLSGECDLALAGGVSLAQPTGYRYQPGGIYSPDGHCRAFDAKANGTIAGNGVGIVVLKRLEDALAEGDRIHAVIKGSAINNDGGNKVSYTAPQIDSQAAVIQAAQTMAEVEPDRITYLEAHGTGTSLGDPIELAALTQAFRLGTSPLGPGQQFCALGSLKPNIGHLDAAAGIASLIKTVLALQHQQIPPSLHSQQPIAALDSSPFYLNTTLSDWRSSTGCLCAGVSSFGIGGTNAHVIVESAPPSSPSGTSRPHQLLVLSARTATALQTAAAHLSAALQQQPAINLADVAYTLQGGRRALEYRWMGVCDSVEQAVQVLSTIADPAIADPAIAPQSPIPASPPRLVWLFPGQGSQYVNMGRELYDTEAVFRDVIDRGCEHLRSRLDQDLRSLLYPTEAGDPAILNQTCYAQPAIFLVEYALAQLWLSWGVRPDALIGHSIGEYVAATLAGVLTFEQALTLVVVRSQWMQACPPGVMLSVALSEPEVKASLAARMGEPVDLAASNAPRLCVVSGTAAAIAPLEAQWSAEGVACRRLPTSHGFHSALMEAAIVPLTEQLRQLTLHPPTTPIVSNLTGTWLTAEQAIDPGYWGNHLRHTVRFADGMATVLHQGNWLGLEVGAGQTLGTLAKQQFPNFGVLSSLRHPHQAPADQALILNTIGQLWLQGVAIAWSQFAAGETRHRLPLPTYPFERQRYWIESQSDQFLSLPAPVALPSSPDSPPIADPSDWFYLPAWEQAPPRLEKTPLANHRRCWLILLDGQGLGDRLAQSLQAAAEDVITVKLGDRFDQVGYRAFTADPDRSSDWVELLEDLQLRELIPTQIVNLWNLTADPLCPHPLAGFYSLLHLSQAILTLKMADPIQMAIVANHTQSVLGNEPLAPLKATVLGLAKVINQELSQVTCRCWDVVLPDQATALDRFTQALIADLTLAPSTLIVAYRGAHAWQPVWRAQPLPLTEPLLLRDRGTYLVVGDFTSGLGSVWVELLSATAATCIVLSSEPIPDVHIIAPKVRVQPTDLNDRAALMAAIAQINTTHGAIHGVFYSTPMSEDRAALIPQLTPIDCGTTFAAKFQNIALFAEVLANQPLDFCLLQSSLASVLGGLGLAAYAAANAAIDALALHQSQTTGIPWISVNWDAWRDLEDAATILASTNPQFGAELAALTLTTAEVNQATRRILAHPLAAQVVVSKGNLGDRWERWINQPLGMAHSPEPTLSHQRPALSTAYIAPQTEIEQAIAEIWQTLLGVEAIGIEDSFFELGGHSLLAIQAISRLRDRFAVELPLRSLLESPTVAGVAAIVVAALPAPAELDAMAALLAEIQHLSPEEVQQQLQV